jgi:hypothetical protein
MAASALFATNESLIICDLLCYARCKLGKLSSITLKSVISDFYTAENISDAKELLVDAVEKLSIDKWPKPARRKQSDNRARVEVDDIIAVFAYLDENLLLDKIPTFVAVNVDNIPSNRIEEGDMRCMLTKLDNFEKTIDLIKNTICVPAKVNNTAPAMGASRDTSSKQSHATWADLGSPHVNVNRGMLKSVESDMDSDFAIPNDSHSAADPPFTVVTRKRMRVLSRNAQNSSATNNNGHQNRIKPKTVVGSSTTCSIKAAKELSKKRFFCVSNVSAETTCDQIKSWIESLNIKVHSVFVAKTRYEDSTSFRVGIDASDVDKFVSNDTWASHIIIRDWVFKNATRESD